MPELLNQQELRRRLPCSLAGSRIPLWVVTIGMGVLSLKRIAMFQLVLRVIGAYIGVGVLSMKRIAGWALGVMFIGGSLGAAELQVGDEAPDFELQGTDGKSYRLSEIRGKAPRSSSPVRGDARYGRAPSFLCLRTSFRFCWPERINEIAEYRDGSTARWSSPPTALVLVPCSRHN